MSAELPKDVVQDIGLTLLLFGVFRFIVAAGRGELKKLWPDKLRLDRRGITHCKPDIPLHPDRIAEIHDQTIKTYARLARKNGELEEVILSRVWKVAQDFNQTHKKENH